MLVSTKNLKKRIFNVQAVHTPRPKSLRYVKGVKRWPWKGIPRLCLLSRRTAGLTCGLMWLFNMVPANRSITSELLVNPLTIIIDIISCSANSSPSAGEILASLASQYRGPFFFKRLQLESSTFFQNKIFFFHGNVFAYHYNLSLMSIILLCVRSKGNARWGSGPKALRN